MKKYLLPILSIVLFSCSNIENNDQVPETAKTETAMPLKEVRSLEAIIEQIKTDTAWYSLILSKAKEQGAPIDTVILNDARYMEVVEAEIVKIENDIILSPEWLKLVTDKAAKQGVSIDEMLKTEASWLNDENKKKAEQAAQK